MDDLDNELFKLPTDNFMFQIADWGQTADFRLGKPTGSAWHKFADAALSNRVLVIGNPEWRSVLAKWIPTLKPQVFLIEHDWAAAFYGAENFEGGEILIPAEVCCFEFVISGRRVISFGDGKVGTALAINAGDWWTLYMYTRDDIKDDETVGSVLGILSEKLFDITANQVRAICVALEAEVATSYIVRAPHKLNTAREKKGKLPIVDYRVVTLANRRAISSLPQTDEPEHGKIRLHFRRGHWRHYEGHKTWIKWTLVGNPDLGFINKHYRM